MNNTTIENEPNIVIQIVTVYSSYTPSQKRAIEKYRKTHIDKCRKDERERKAFRLQNDPEYRDKINEQRRTRYLKKKQLKKE